MRFINADDTSYIGADGSFVSYNLFAYCNNNPVMNIDPSGCLLSPVASCGSFYDSYKVAVAIWSYKYAKMSNGVEYGAIIYKFRIGFRTRYFMGETYKGFKTTNWYTIINGLGVGYLRGRVRCKVSTKYFSSLKMIGFAHTHPIGNTNKPSGPDKIMKKIGFFVGLKKFPIAIYNGENTQIRYF